ncbi:CBS domain-containing protein [Natrarchaeobaculum aegyptiacum]|uniref:CBS domain-containing protein n=1 Tax=Natrarchaeobaculum aegyptiacum TaxID=745377 RepID=A0A2Z2HV21_9EURY|nr:CBS domain-containing protein [Natrarchaeobaculum aegyptiacum]ARS90623.1 hypothetical protein B1756_13400 [Natrarchaeobaculum aegyptiacum]
MGLRVADVMTTDVGTCDAETTLETVTAAMLKNRVGSVVVTDDGNPSGIVTETDVIGAAYSTGDPLTAISTRAVASHPLVTIDDSRTIRETIARMETEGVKKLVVVDGLSIVAIVTMGDVVRHFDEISTEIRHLERRRIDRTPDWAGE